MEKKKTIKIQVALFTLKGNDDPYFQDCLIDYLLFLLALDIG